MLFGKKREAVQLMSSRMMWADQIMRMEEVRLFTESEAMKQTGHLKGVEYN